MPNNPSRSSAKSKLIGGGAVILALIGVIIAIMQLWSSTKDSSVQMSAQATLITISNQQLQAQQTLVELQKNPTSPQEIENIQGTITALENKRLLVQSTLNPKDIDSKTTLGSTEPGVTLLFEDNFDNGISPDWIVLNGDPIVTDGRLGSAEGNLNIGLGGNLPNDFSIQFDYKWYYSDISLIFNDSFRYILFADRTKWYAFKENQWIEIASSDGPPNPEGQFRLTVTGNKYTVFFNGIKENEIVYGSPLNGKLQIGLSNDKGFIDNLKITSP